jgi:predicted CXXCH cytochrome family protein
MLTLGSGLASRRSVMAGAAITAAFVLASARPAAVLADGGPHVLAANNGTAGLAGDCAACHRAHTAAAADLLKTEMPGLCLTCHDGTGATTDVADGLQYTPSGGPGFQQTTVLGALRGGGFSYALIDSSDAARLVTGTRIATGWHGHVGVLDVTAKEPVTSTHGGAGSVWGNGADGTPGAGATGVVLSCTSCHNPHGNGQYRILDTLPGGDWANGLDGVASWTAPTNQVEVADTANPTNAARNYTILPGSLAADVAIYGPTQGDYWRKSLPWTSSSAPDSMQRGWSGAPTNAASNGGVAPSNSTGLMTAWCLTCHTRYSGRLNDDGPSDTVPQPDDIFMYRHLTETYGCEQCHVSHGSNALMTTSAELVLTDPAGGVPAPIPGAGPAASPVTSGDSRLLKVDERGTCQLCHDPTGTVTSGYVGPTPTPGTP